MASLTTIRTVKVSYESAGAEKFRADADSAAASQDNLGRAADKAAVATEQAARRIGSATTSYDRIRSSVDPVYRAQLQLEQQTLKLGSAFQRGGTDAASHAQTLALLEARYSSVANAAQNAAAAEVSRARAEQTASSAQYNINQLLGVDRSTGSSARASAAIFEEAAREREAAEALVAAREEFISTARAQQSALTAQFDINGRLGVDAGTKSARASAAVFEELYREEADQQRRLVDLRSTSAKNVAAGWGQLGAQGSAALANIEASRRLGTLGAPQAANQNNRQISEEFRNQALLNIGIQGKDFFEQVLSGSSPIRAGLMQLPTATTIAGQAGLGAGDVIGGIAGKVKDLADGAAGAVRGLGLVGGAIGVVTTAAGLGITALASYRAQQKDLQLSLSGIGRASGASVGQINASALGSAMGAGLSVSSARDMAAEYAATGRIGSEMYGKLLGSARDYAATTRQEVPDANKALAEAFADPVKGAEMLNAQLGFLDATTKETVERFDAQGNRLAAQKALFDAFSTSLVNADQRLGFFSRQWLEFSRNTSNEFDAIGRFVDKGLGGGDAEERLKTLQSQLSFRQRNMGTAGGIFDGLLGFDVDTIKKQIAEVQAEIDKASKQRSMALLAQRGLQTDALVRSLNPTTQSLKQLEDGASRIRKDLADGVIDKDGTSRRSMDGLAASAKQLREDMAAGGTAFANAVRDAQYGLKTVGFTPQGRSAADINKRAEDDIRSANLNREDPLLRDFQINSIKERQRLELQTLTSQSSLDLTTGGGAFARLSGQIQQQILAAAQNPQFGQIPANIVAAIAEREASGNLNVGYTKERNPDGSVGSAYGLGQITRDTAADAVRRGFLPGDFDRMDTSTMVEGIFGVLQMKLKDAGGDLGKALNNYGTGPGYSADIFRRAGQMGDPSTQGLIRDQDALTRSQRDASQQLDNLNRNYGVNGAALETIQQRQAKYNELLDRGVSASDAASIAFGGLIDKTVTLAQQAKLVQFGRDDDFARAQLGRDATDQQAYARARSLVGDTSTPAAQAVIERSRATIDLADQKSMITDGVTSFATALRRGGDAAEALSNAFGNAADKLISKALDSVISQGFGMLTKGGGGDLFGSIGKLFGFADGGWTGPAAPHVPVGVVHGNEYVFDARATARIGVGTLEAMRRGVRGYEIGGFVGNGSHGGMVGMPAANGNAGPPVVNVINNSEPVSAEVKQRSDGSMDIILDKIEARSAGRVASAQGPLAAAVSGGRRLRG